MRPPHNTQDGLAADTGDIDATFLLESVNDPFLLESVDGSFLLDSVNGDVTDGALEMDGSKVLLCNFDDFWNSLSGASSSSLEISASTTGWGDKVWVSFVAGVISLLFSASLTSVEGETTGGRMGDSVLPTVLLLSISSSCSMSESR